MRRELYGIAEIAESLGLTRQTVTVWRKRRSWSMPEPDAELASGPVWRSNTIEPWISAHQSRLAGQDAQAGVPLQPGDVRRAARRLLRLLALLLEEPVRPLLVDQALADVRELVDQTERAAEDDTREQLLAVLQPVAAGAGEDVGHLIRQLLERLPELAGAVIPLIGDAQQP